MSAVRETVQEIFREVLNDPDLVLRDDLTADEVEGWDSLTHVSLLFSIESEFGIQFSDAEMGGLQNVGQLLEIVEARASAA